MEGAVRWMLAGTIVFLVAVVPVGFYRAVYAHGKRLREVSPERVYRSGQMTAPGFAEAVDRYHIRTVINLQDDYPDPDIDRRWLGGGTVTESELCRQLGVRFVFIAPDLIPRAPGTGTSSRGDRTVSGSDGRSCVLSCAHSLQGRPPPDRGHGRGVPHGI